MKQDLPIWEIIHHCAKDLEKSGDTPFTRGDIIKCVQRKIPNCSPDSINPIIQGLTDNLRGGAPGAAGKNLLHNVGRGLFILRTSSSAGLLTGATPNRRVDPKSVTDLSLNIGSTQQEFLAVEDYDFKLVCQLKVETDEEGKIREFRPQLNYANAASIPLNRYGKGLFCKFKVPTGLEKPGVYIISSKRQPLYVGECINLSARFNAGYGNISPRNCYVGGQETNCRINNLIFTAVKDGTDLFLWFFETPDYKSVETRLRQSVSFPWNRA